MAAEIFEIELDVDDKHALFERIGDLMEAHHDAIIDALEARETEGDTGIDGVAVPHARVEGLDHSVLVDVQLDRAVRWGDRDVKRCYCLLSARRDPRAHLELLGEVARRNRSR